MVKNTMRLFLKSAQNFKPSHGLKLLFAVCVGTALASSPDAHNAQQVSVQNDAGITMTGRCPNGDAFRLVAYDQQVDGLWKSFYDYQGPVGTGTVKTKTAPKVMVSRVCIALAEIASDE
jgi:hypothetical protein